MPPTSPQWHTATFTAHTAKEPPSATTLPVSAFPRRGFRKAGEPAQFSLRTESCRCSLPSCHPRALLWWQNVGELDGARVLRPLSSGE